MALFRVFSEIFNVENVTLVKGHSRSLKVVHSVDRVWFDFLLVFFSNFIAKTCLFEKFDF